MIRDRIICLVGFIILIGAWWYSTNGDEEVNATCEVQEHTIVCKEV